MQSNLLTKMVMGNNKQDGHYPCTRVSWRGRGASFLVAPSEAAPTTSQPVQEDKKLGGTYEYREGMKTGSGR